LPLLVNRATAEILDAEDGRDLLVARDADETAAALDRLSSDSDLRQRLVDGGREKLRSNHDPARVAEHLTRIYRWAIDR
jgi:glycosyltransferase involved in cell wall biosynthesis